MLAAVYNVRSFGAKGDGKAIDSHAINRAIETAAASGGGTVFLPAGTYLSGSIRMKSNINLHPRISAPVSSWPSPPIPRNTIPPKTSPAPTFRMAATPSFHNSLIWGENLDNISITGQGMIDGGGITSRRQNPSATAPSISPTKPSPSNFGTRGGGGKATWLLPASSSSAMSTLFHGGGHFASPRRTGSRSHDPRQRLVPSTNQPSDGNGYRSLPQHHRLQLPRQLPAMTASVPSPASASAKTASLKTSPSPIAKSPASSKVLFSMVPCSPPPAAPAASSSAPRPTAASATSPSPTAPSATAAAWRWKKSTAASSKTSTSPTSP